MGGNHQRNKSKENFPKLKTISLQNQKAKKASCSTNGKKDMVKLQNTRENLKTFGGWDGEIKDQE